MAPGTSAGGLWAAAGHNRRWVKIFSLTLLVLVPFTRLRAEFLLRLYQDVAAHPAYPTKRKSESR